ncbi:MAG: Cof-type HAD-IIB family hydrolase [Clostridia bacterium]|nr:Cof-type HAD-IIB family hydrolase [Clostridia bacterium]
MSDIYSKWLIVSDVDGTLNNKIRKLPEINRLKIKEYVDKGGYFTLCSGRNLQSITPHYKKLSIETPAIFLNGAGIYDFKTEKLLSFTGVESEAEEAIIECANLVKSAQVSVFTDNMIYHIKPKTFGYIMSWADNLDNTVCKGFDEVPRGRWGKIIFFGLPHTLKKVLEFFNKDEVKPLCNTFRSSLLTVEVVAKDVDKGKAVLRLAELLGIERGNIGAIGDYYNDVAMLKSVEHPACCGQAPKDIKALAEYVTCHCNNGAVADFINYIENKYIENKTEG